MPHPAATPSLCVPRGFRLAGVHCGIKRNPQKEDLALVVSEAPAAAAGVYTQNLVFAAPVAFDRQRTPSGRVRVVVVNSGNANACTGRRGLADAAEMARLAAAAVGAAFDEALVLSTGVIGTFLPMEKIAAGVQAAAAAMGADERALVSAARGMLTTDTRHKLAGRQLVLDGRPVQITGMAKGAAMIGPRMATMLGLLLTDAPLSAATAQELLGRVVEESFNCISVEGHMSTNDTVLLLANGAAGGGPLAGPSLLAFEMALLEVCLELARAIPEDGEGASHLVTLHVEGCASREAARRIAKTVAESALVKAAIAGGDPNWGRIVSAAGYAGVPFDPAGVSLKLNGCLLYEHGAPVPFDAAAVSRSLREQRETQVQLTFAEGQAGARFWTTDLTPEYVRLNADYHT
jgi:glutamate N-acetyltransferase/amino-acid N-acetyltransferase